MPVIRFPGRVPARHFRLLRLAVVGAIAMLMLAVAANPTFAQTPVPSAPTNLTAELTDTEGEVQLAWDAAEGATSYRACRRVQSPPGGWSCVTRKDTDALFQKLTVGTTYDFAVASYDGKSYSSWVWTEAKVETIVLICPITGIAIPGGYLSVNETMTATNGKSFTLTGITRKSNITLSGTNYQPITGRQFLKVCGTVKAPSDNWTIFYPGSSNNLATDLGVGFVVPDDSVTDWYDVGRIQASETKSGCDVWEVPTDTATVLYAVENFRANAAVFRVDLPAN